MPNTTFSQNNGVIAMTKCASRRAGFFCAGWMFFLGVFGKFAGIIVAIPDCVLGGMTIFLFANVLTSGINMTHNVDLDSRRNKFIYAWSLCIGVGVCVWPFAFQDMRASPYTAAFWTCADCGSTMKGIRNGVSIFLSTGYCVGTVLAIILNALLPEDAGTAYSNQDDPLMVRRELDASGNEKPIAPKELEELSDDAEDVGSNDKADEGEKIGSVEETA
jgi:xanthine/uracil permease